jgi:hypothetical protein
MASCVATKALIFNLETIIPFLKPPRGPPRANENGDGVLTVWDIRKLVR